MLLKAGVAAECCGWCRRKGRWQVRRVAVRLDDLAGVVLESPTHRHKSRGERQRNLFGSGDLKNHTTMLDTDREPM
jgi:hypothetical protein